jgi:hypothetical protein
MGDCGDKQCVMPRPCLLLSNQTGSWTSFPETDSGPRVSEGRALPGHPAQCLQEWVSTLAPDLWAPVPLMNGPISVSLGINAECSPGRGQRSCPPQAASGNTMAEPQLPAVFSLGG